MPAKYLLRTDNDPMALPYSIVVENCYLHDVVIGSDGNFLRAYEGTFADTLIFRNSLFSNCGKEGLRIKDADNTVGYFELDNCTFWKTNKEEASDEYPAYVVHWTDYSPGRKQPLQRTVKVAPDEKTAEEIAEALIAKNVKKGWQEVSE